MGSNKLINFELISNIPSPTELSYHTSMYSITPNIVKFHEMWIKFFLRIELI